MAETSDNTQHSQETDIHAPGGIRTHDLSRRAAADLRLRPGGHWAPDNIKREHYALPCYNSVTVGLKLIKYTGRLSPRAYPHTAQKTVSIPPFDTSISRLEDAY